jgi:hemerythrin-like domain-containing protein
MSDAIAGLIRDHANMAKLLELLESEILAIEVGKTPDYPLLQDIMRYMTRYPELFHHPTENSIFAQVLKREPGARADITELLREHISISLAGQNFVRLLRTSHIDSVDARERLGTAGSAYIRTLREHISKEEKKLFPMANAVLTKEDWRLINDKIDTIEDCLFGDVIADEYQRLYRLITDRTAADAVAECIDL